MIQTYDPKQLGARLKKELKLAGMSTMQFQKEVERTAGGVRGSSYASVWAYVEGSGPQEVKWELLTAFANVLNVLPEYLAYGGPRTEEEKRVQQVAADAEFDWQAPCRPIQKGFGNGSERLTEDVRVAMVILGTWTKLCENGPWTKDAALQRVHAVRIASRKRRQRLLMDYSSADYKKFQDLVGEQLGTALRAPFADAGLQPTDLTDDEFHDYITLICQGFSRLIQANRRRYPQHGL